MKRKVYETLKEKRLDFALGFVGWFVINALLALLSWDITLDSASRRGAVSQDLVTPLVVLCCGVIPLLINLIGMVLLASSRKWMALGALTAFTVAFFLTLCAGLYELARCFMGPY